MKADWRALGAIAARDGVGLGGMAAIVAGIAQVSGAAALIAGGAMAVAIAWLLGRKG